MLPGSLTSGNSVNFQAVLRNLRNFTERLVNGVSELARNITEHSSDRFGAITLRMYSGERFSELVGISTSTVSGKLDALKRSPFIFDINVIDLGHAGVTETLRRVSNRW